jgi:hypothetical protein
MPNWMIEKREFALNAEKWKYILEKECASKSIEKKIYFYNFRNFYQRITKKGSKSHRNKIICVECGEIKMHQAKGMCK